MFVSWIRYAKGFVGFRVTGKSPERFLNLCAQRGIRLWSCRPTDKGIQGRMTASDYRSIRPVARRAGVRAQTLYKRGLPFAVRRYRGRAGLPIGAVLGVVLLVILSQFVWNVHITGAQTVSEQRLKTLLAESGVRIGAYTKGVDAGQVKRDVLLQAEEIGWMSVNLHGSRADVAIKEKARKPDVEDTQTPCNVKAAADGVITKMIAENGEARVKVGSGVAKGDLLVSGVSVTKQNTVRYLHAKAEVWADVHSNIELKVPKNIKYYSINENKTERRRISILGFEFPCSLSFRSFNSAAYTRDEADWQLNGVTMPLGIVTETAHELTCEPSVDSPEQARRVFDNALLLHELFRKGESRVVKKQVELRETGDGFLGTAAYVFNENIAESVDFSAAE